MSNRSMSLNRKQPYGNHILKFPYLLPNPIIVKHLIQKWMEFDRYHTSILQIFETDSNYSGSLKIDTNLRDTIMKMPGTSAYGWSPLVQKTEKIASKMFYYCIANVLDDIIYDQLFKILKQSGLIQRLTIPVEIIDIIVATGKTTSLKKILEYEFKKRKLDFKKFIVTKENLIRKKDILENYANISLLKKKFRTFPRISHNDLIKKISC